MDIVGIRTFAAATYLVGCVLWLNGCRHCDSCTSLAIKLPSLNAKVSQSVEVTFQQVDGSSDPITCTWIAPKPSYDPIWICHKSSQVIATGDTQGTNYYDISDAKKNWAIQLTGPTGTQTFARTPTPNDPGEGWPTSCFCDEVALQLSTTELESVGATLSYSSPPIDAGTDGG
jgi:hypothetical protein